MSFLGECWCEARFTARAISDIRYGILPKIAFLLGLSYLFIPLDLIPNKTPYIGYLDEITFLIGGIVSARRLASPPDAEPKRASASSAKAPASWRRSQRVFGALVMRSIPAGCSPLLLRLMLGRWADAEECRLFRMGFAERGHALPPLLRAIANVPAARPYINRAMMVAAVKSDDGAARSIGPATRAAQIGDPLRLWQGPTVAFMHLEKTGGTTVATVLGNQFHPLQIDPDPKWKRPPHLHAPFPPETIGQQRRYAFVSGHYDLPSIRRFDPERFVLTVLRDPRRRILSHYFFLRVHRSPAHPVIAASQSRSLIEFLRSDEPLVRNFVDNLYVRRLCGSYLTSAGFDPVAAHPERSLEIALEALERFSFIGITEQIDMSLVLLGKLLNFSPPAVTPRVNVTAAGEANPMIDFTPSAREKITPEIEAELSRLTRLDQVVYARALERFAALKASAPAMPSRR